MKSYELAQRLRQRPVSADSLFGALTGQTHDRVISKTTGFGYYLVTPADFATLFDVLAMGIYDGHRAKSCEPRCCGDPLCLRWMRRRWARG